MTKISLSSAPTYRTKAISRPSGDQAGSDALRAIRRVMPAGLQQTKTALSAPGARCRRRTAGRPAPTTGGRLPCLPPGGRGRRRRGAAGRGRDGNWTRTESFDRRATRQDQGTGGDPCPCSRGSAAACPSRRRRWRPARAPSWCRRAAFPLVTRRRVPGRRSAAGRLRRAGSRTSRNPRVNAILVPSGDQAGSLSSPRDVSR
jgi:hypothetical protein